MNRKALQKLSYGVYLVTTAQNGKSYGCVANSAMQITSSPAQIAVSINHDNATHDQIAQSGKFALSILATDTDPALIGGFGYRSNLPAFPAQNMTVCRCRMRQWLGSPAGW